MLLKSFLKNPTFELLLLNFKTIYLYKMHAVLFGVNKRFCSNKKTTNLIKLQVFETELINKYYYVPLSLPPPKISLLAETTHLFCFKVVMIMNK